MKRLAAILVVVLVVACVVSWAGEDKLADKCFEKLPPGWSIKNSEVMSPEQTKAIGVKLGVPILKLSNTLLVVHATPIQVNICDVRTEADAVRLHQTMSKTKEHPAFCLRIGKRVIEYVGKDPALATKLSYELGFLKKPTQIRYRVTAQISTIDKADYMALNELFKLLLRANAGATDWTALGRIAELSKRFEFGTSVTLRSPQQSDTRPTYSFEPEPKGQPTVAGDAVTYSFEDLPEVCGVPYVTLTAGIACDDTGVTPTDRAADETLLCATAFWPVDDSEITALAETIVSGKPTTEAKVQAILEWLAPGKNIQMGGPVTGSRWGVKKVLGQKFGCCWDSSDCFVTLCRAAGIPCRQVAGWLYGASGHIWAEVLFEGTGWRQVDPTGGGKLGCGIYHIPYFTTETGEMPILYVSRPVIEIVSTE